MPLRFLKSYFKLEILIFLSLAVSFKYAQLKSSFSDEKRTAVKSGTHFRREPLGN